MPTAEVKRCLVSVYHLAPQISEAFMVFVLLGQMLVKRHPLIHLTDYALSLSLSACFLRTRFMMSSRGQGTAPKRLCLIACVLKWATQTANFWAQIILDPYRRPLTLTFLLVSTRGLFQDMMFERLRDSTFSEDASEVLVQPLPCGTIRKNKMTLYSLL